MDWFITYTLISVEVAYFTVLCLLLLVNIHMVIIWVAVYSLHTDFGMWCLRKERKCVSIVHFSGEAVFIEWIIHLNNSIPILLSSWWHKSYNLLQVKGLSTEELVARNDLVLALPDRIQAIPDGTAAAPKQSGGWGASASRTEIKFDSGAVLILFGFILQTWNHIC